MYYSWHLLADLAIILLLLLGVWRFRTPRGARTGNIISAVALLCAVVAVLIRHPVCRYELPIVLSAGAMGTVAGWVVAVRVNMIQIPAMVAFQHGAGGIAALLVSFVELTRQTQAPMALTGEVSGILGLIIGAATFSGSMIASGKLANRLKQTPTVLPQHNALLTAVAAAIVVAGIVVVKGQFGRIDLYLLIALICLSCLLGLVFSIRIGGADMPVLISFLNATAGLAAAFCGVAIQNRLLIACGATVAASGSILTQVMCRGMNRHLTGLFLGIRLRSQGDTAGIHPDRNVESQQESKSVTPRPEAETADGARKMDPLSQAIEVAKSAKTVVVIPGYGMALSEAQFAVVQLAEKLIAGGKDVRFAIHPVAGRMPGHMHVVLAEAEVDYSRLYEMDQINSEFCNTDLALVVGACDVVNPAAIGATGTPISGMPILNVHEAKHVVVCNLDEKPGYSGVENPLYRNPKTILLLGDAKDNVGRLLQGVD